MHTDSFAEFYNKKPVFCRSVRLDLSGKYAAKRLRDSFWNLLGCVKYRKFTTRRRNRNGEKVWRVTSISQENEPGRLHNK